MKICDFTVKELYFFERECNFTKDELALFEYRSQNIPLEECAEKMDVSVSTVKRTNRRIKNKIERVIGLRFIEA